MTGMLCKIISWIEDILLKMWFFYICSIALWINTYESSKFSNGALMRQNLFDAFEKTERLFQ